jgi:hypothetical protein
MIVALPQEVGGAGHAAFETSSPHDFPARRTLPSVASLAQASQKVFGLMAQVLKARIVGERPHGYTSLFARTRTDSLESFGVRR